ncbi:MAG: hypothetical protein VB131_09830 [Burkholderia gladioli]
MNMKPLLPKPLFYDVEQEIRDAVIDRAYWRYWIFQLSRGAAKWTFIFSIAEMLIIVGLGNLLQAKADISSDQATQLVDSFVPYISCSMIVAVLASIVSFGLWGELQPVVRDTARSLKG